MSEFTYVSLYAKYAGLRIMVLANQLACDDDLSRAAHDTLVEKLDQLIALTRRAIAAERELAVNPTRPDAQDLGEVIWEAGRALTDYWGDPEGTDLLRNDIHIDWATKEWYDARTGQWHFLDGYLPPRIEIGDDRLNGLCAILRQIWAETGIRFNTYTTDPAYMGEAAAGDRACDEALCDW